MNERRNTYRDMRDVRDEGGLVHLDVDVCLDLLGSRHVGRVAVSGDGGPIVFPVNYTVDAGTVVFRTGMGSKLAAADRRAFVAFQVDDVDVERRTGWSVLVRGRLLEVTDGDELDRLAELPLEPFAGGDRDHYVRVMANAVSGRRITVPEAVPTEWLTPSSIPAWGTEELFRPTSDDRAAWTAWV